MYRKELDRSTPYRLRSTIHMPDHAGVAHASVTSPSARENVTHHSPRMDFDALQALTKEPRRRMLILRVMIVFFALPRGVDRESVVIPSLKFNLQSQSYPLKTPA